MVERSAYSDRYSTYQADEKRRKTALSNKTRSSSASGSAYPVGALVGLRQAPTPAGADPQAATNIGDLMTPSTFGREGPPSSEEEFQQRKQRNMGFLQSREAQAALLQFGVSMLSSAGGGNFAGNVGRAIALAAGAPGRLHKADRLLTDEERKTQLEEKRAELADRQIAISEQELTQKERELAQKELTRTQTEDILSGLPLHPTDDDLTERAAHLVSIGNIEGANVILKMISKPASMDPMTALKIDAYNRDKVNGYPGNIIQWENDQKAVAAIEKIRQNLMKGVYTVETMPAGDKAVWDASQRGDPLLNWLLSQHPNLEPEQPGTPPTSSTNPTSGTSGNVRFEAIPEGQQQ